MQLHIQDVLRGSQVEGAPYGWRNSSVPQSLGHTGVTELSCCGGDVLEQLRATVSTVLMVEHATNLYSQGFVDEGPFWAIHKRKTIQLFMSGAGSAAAFRRLQADSRRAPAATYLLHNQTSLESSWFAAKFHHPDLVAHLNTYYLMN